MSEQGKQIEEMARDLSETYKGNDCLFTNACDICEYSKYQGNKEYPCGAMKHAKEMIVRGYQKEKQGEWVKPQFLSRTGFFTIREFTCNQCNKFFEVREGNEFMNYCPNCGAKMKGAE